KYLTNNYPHSGTDTYVMFWELALKISRLGGFTGYITPNTFLVTEGGQKIRRLLYEQTTYKTVMEAFDVFSDAIVETIVVVLQKGRPKNDYTFDGVLTARGKELFQDKLNSALVLNFKAADLVKRDDLIFNYREKNSEKVLYDKLRKQPLNLGTIAKITSGVKPYEVGKGTPPQTQDIVTNKPYTGFANIDDAWKPVVRGGDVNRFSLRWSGEFIKYGPHLAAPRKPENFSKDKIFIRRTDDRVLAVLDNDSYVGINSVHCLQIISPTEWDYKFITGLLNSSVMNWYFQHENFHMVNKPLAEVKVVFIERLPIPNVTPAEQQPFIDLAEQLLSGHRALHAAEATFAALLRAELGLSAPLTGKLAPAQEWKPWSTALSTSLGRPLTLAEKSEWLPYHQQHQQQQAVARQRLARLDKELDALVYALYGLTPAEIALVEGSAAA
ncbi:MAG TPA: TaqI-like C-terminal specificity domain-containing protein, partial [Hymenobacter sp.]